VHLAVALPLASGEYWYVLSDEPTEVKTCPSTRPPFAICRKYWH